MPLPGYEFLGLGESEPFAPPRNELDAVAQDHDLNYQDYLDSNLNPYWNSQAADDLFIEDAAHIPGTAAFLARNYFKLKRAIMSRQSDVPIESYLRSRKKRQEFRVESREVSYTKPGRYNRTPSLAYEEEKKEARSIVPRVTKKKAKKVYWLQFLRGVGLRQKYNRFKYMGKYSRRKRHKRSSRRFTRGRRRYGSRKRFHLKRRHHKHYRHSGASQSFFKKVMRIINPEYFASIIQFTRADNSFVNPNQHSYYDPAYTTDHNGANFVGNNNLWSFNNLGGLFDYSKISGTAFSAGAVTDQFYISKYCQKYRIVNNSNVPMKLNFRLFHLKMVPTTAATLVYTIAGTVRSIHPFDLIDQTIHPTTGVMAVDEPNPMHTYDMPVQIGYITNFGGTLKYPRYLSGPFGADFFKDPIIRDRVRTFWTIGKKRSVVLPPSGTFRLRVGDKKTHMIDRQQLTGTAVGDVYGGKRCTLVLFDWEGDLFGSTTAVLSGMNTGDFTFRIDTSASFQQKTAVHPVYQRVINTDGIEGTVSNLREFTVDANAGVAPK